MVATLTMAMPVSSIVMATFAAILVVPIMVMGHILLLVPVLAHKIHWPTAGVVLCTMLAPVLLMARRNVEIDRIRDDDLRRTLDYDGLRIDQCRWRQLTQVNLAIETQTIDANGDADVIGERGYRPCGGKRGEQQTFYNCILL